MESILNCFTKLGNSLDDAMKAQRIEYRVVRAIRDGEHQELSKILSWECRGIRYKVRIKEPIEPDIITDVGIPDHVYKGEDKNPLKGATMLELAAALGQTKCVEVLLDLGYQMSYRPIVKS